jgi:UDP-glucose 4-epimerase
MKIGVIGSNGFLGRSLCLKFLKEDCIVYAFFNKNTESIPNGCNLIPLNTTFNENLDSLFISIGGHNCSYDQFLDQYLLINNIIKNIKFNKIFFISSIEVYGINKNKISINSCFYNPSSYGLSKLSQEFLIKSLDNYIIIRPTYLFGEKMNKNSLIPMWIDKAKNNKTIQVYGEGDRKQDYLYIGDLVELCWLVLNKNKKNITLIAATGKSTSNIDIAKEINEKFRGTNLQKIGKDYTLSTYIDIDYTKKMYLWSPKISIIDWLKLR